MTVFVPTELRKCGACKKDYVTALATQQENGELAPWEEPCPYCRTTPTVAGAAAAPSARRELGCFHASPSRR